MIPHNNELNTKFGKRGLVVVGVTNEPEKLVSKYVADNKVEYPIFIETSYKSSNALKVSGYPSAFLVDPKGTVVWAGHPSDLTDSEIEKALKGAKPPGIKLPAALKALEPLMTKKDFGKAWEAAKAMLAGSLDADAKTAAEELVAGIESDAKALVESSSKHIEAKEYFEAQSELDQLGKQYAGVPGTESAAGKLQELQANAEIRKAIKAGEQLAKAGELESSSDFDKAYAGYKAVVSGYAGTQPATAAAARMQDLEQKGMLGFDKKCNACNEQKHACPKHKKKPPK